MKIKWKLRLQNKATLIALVTAVIAFVYQILGFAGVVPAVSESQIVECAGMLINILVMLGIVTDPPTHPRRFYIATGPNYANTKEENGNG